MRYPRVLLPARSSEDWKLQLASPEVQWKTGYSAKTLAKCWLEASNKPGGFPREIRVALQSAGTDALADAEMLLAIPECRVALPGGSKGSQSDIMVLARGRDGGLVTMVVEGKVGEGFGRTVSSHLASASAKWKSRLLFICEKLGVNEQAVGDQPYQLLHRAVSAVLLARRFTAPTAVMAVHSFGSDNSHFDKYAAFVKLLVGRVSGLGEITPGRLTSDVCLHLTWVRGDDRFLT
jgi:hypothetical protein